MAKRKSKNLLVLDGTLTTVDRNHKTMFSRQAEKKHIAFVCLALFVVAVLILLTTQGMISFCISFQDETETPGQTEAPILKFDDDDSLTVVWLKLADDGVGVEHVILTRYEPSENSVYLTPMPPQLSAGERTLAGYYAIGGGRAVADVVSQMIGIENVYYSTIDYNGIKSLVSEFGGVTIDLPCSINYTDADSKKSINVAAGKRVFEGGETARLLNCPQWPEGVNQQRLMYAKVFAGLINENLTPKRAEVIDELFGRITPHIKTDVTMDVIQRCSGGLSHLATINENGNIALIMEIGTYIDVNGAIHCSGDSLEDMKILYGDRKQQA